MTARRAPRAILIDDDRETRELLCQSLQRNGFEVTQAANGLKLISTLQVDRPDIILLDVNLTWSDGYELCRSVKRNESFRDIPVVLVSARAGADDVKKGLAAGASDYFTKPVELDTLLARARELVAGSSPEDAEND